MMTLFRTVTRGSIDERPPTFLQGARFRRGCAPPSCRSPSSACDAGGSATCLNVTARIAVICSLLPGIGCAGGGGSQHLPPATITRGEVTPIRLELSVWGAGSGAMSSRYTDVTCVYKTEAAPTPSRLLGIVEQEAEDRMVVLFRLPAFNLEDGSFVEYFFEMKFDGVPNRRDGARIPLR